MDVQQQIQLLQGVMRDSSELLEHPKAELSPQPKPSLALTFKRGVCPWLEKEEEVSVFLDIHSARCVGTDLPHLRFTTYFPYPVARNDIHLRFILEALYVLNKEMPFVELGVVDNSRNQEVLVFRCNRLLIPPEINAAEILFFVQRVVVAIEWFVEAYEAFLRQNGIRIS